MSTADETKSGPSFVTIPTAIMRIKREDLSFAAKCLYGQLRLHAHLPPEPHIGEVQGPCYPREDTLANEVGVSRERVSEVKRELEECGLIAWRRTGRSNHYEIFHPSGFRPSDRNKSAGRADRKKGSDQRGRKAPFRADQTSRSDRKESTDKKNNKRAPNRAPGKDAPAGGLAVPLGDCAMYSADEPDFG